MSSAPSRNSSDPVAAARASALVRVVDAIRAVGASNPVVLIDGRSGAGKSTLAHALVAHWPLRGRVQLVGLDSIYPGWDGLAHGVELARTQILVPHARGMVGVWQRWEWETDTAAEAYAVDPSLPLIIEGSGILTPVTARLGDVRVWIDSPDESRKRRALERDGDAYRPHWGRWAAQEERHLARNEPSAHATVSITIP